MSNAELQKRMLADTALPQGRSCPACGSPADVRDKYCVACGAELPVVDPSVPTFSQTSTPQQPIRIPAPDAPVQDQKTSPTIKTSSSAIGSNSSVELKSFRCQNCGAEITVDPSSRSYVCPFCDSTYVLELNDLSDRQRPEFVVGFSVTPEQAWEKFLAWTREGNLFRPLNLRKVEMPEKLRGVYLPFWSFSMLAKAAWRAEIGEYWYRTETYTTTVNGKTETHTRQVQETEWWPLEGRFQHYYYGYLVSGSKGLEQRFAEAIKPFHIEAVKRYEPYFLAGWLSEEFTIERDAALAICEAQFTNAAQNDIANFLPGDTQRGLGCQLEFDDVNSDLILLPVYVLTYQYKSKVYHFVMNGQTGKIFGERPLSWTRILFYALGAVLTGVAIGLASHWFR